MSVMFDPDTAIYPFPPKPTPLSIDEKAYYREKIKRLLKERNAVMVAWISAALLKNLTHFAMPIPIVLSSSTPTLLLR